MTGGTSGSQTPSQIVGTGVGTLIVMHIGRSTARKRKKTM
jgi:hypothetical protein